MGCFWGQRPMVYGSEFYCLISNNRHNLRYNYRRNCLCLRLS